MKAILLSAIFGLFFLTSQTVYAQKDVKKPTSANKKEMKAPSNVSETPNLQVKNEAPEIKSNDQQKAKQPTGQNEIHAVEPVNGKNALNQSDSEKIKKRYSQKSKGKNKGK